MEVLVVAGGVAVVIPGDTVGVIASVGVKVRLSLAAALSED